MRRAAYRSLCIYRTYLFILCCLFVLFLYYYNSKNTSLNLLEAQNAVKHVAYSMHSDETDKQILLLTKQGYLNIDTKSLEFKAILKPSLFGNLPDLYNFEDVNPEIHLKGPQNFFRSPPTLIIAIPTVKRNVKNYFEQTIENLMSNLQDYEVYQVLFLIADFSNDKSYTNKIVSWLQSKYPQAVEHGLFEVITPPSYYYPVNLKSLAPTFNDSSSRMYWRTKQNLDYAYLMTFARIAHMNSNFYIQLEDDVLATSGYVTQIINFVSSKPNFFSCEFSQLGFIGKLFRVSNLHYLTNSILMFYKDKPVDWIVSDLFNSRFCSPEVNCAKSINGVYRFIQKPPLFQHVGKYSSLTNKVQLLREKSFQRGSKPKIENHLLNDYNVQITQIPNSTIPIDALISFFKYGQPLQIDKPPNNLELNFNFDEPIQMKHAEVRFALKYNSKRPQVDFPLVVEAIFLSNSTTTGVYQKLNSTSRYFYNYEGAQQTLLSNLRVTLCEKDYDYFVYTSLLIR
ncbi:hypothetical protein M3Y97_00858100 [Aphelenchoides bicaudatus]|nr:hypothetical protein M3Y97_00858100 [Aphelenchoides bicaudatus]